MGAESRAIVNLQAAASPIPHFACTRSLDIMGDFTPVPEGRERIFAFAKFNLDALLSLATQLRGSRPCTTDVSKRPKTGSLNWVIFITFDHEIEWVFRSPRRSMSIKTESHYKMIISEACTLKYLGKHSSAPVPEVYSFSGSHDNEIGVPYILMSKASGRALSEYDWSEASRIPGYTLRTPLLPLTDRNREKIMGQLRGIMSLLSEIHFDKIGSLFEAQDGSSDCSVGECLNPSLFWEKRDTLEGIDPSWASYKAAVDRWEDFYLLGEGAEGSKNRLSYCLAGEFLREMIPSLTSHASQSRGFAPCHPDLHTGNIFVDENFNVTSIIDWGSAYAGPLSELLATPGLSGSISPPGESIVAAFRAGFGQGGKRSNRSYYTLFKTLFELAHEDGSDDIPRMFHQRSMQEHGKELLAKLREDAEGEETEEDESEEEEGGPKMKTERIAVARKLMLMSETNPNFVADKRLWRWLGDALDKADFE
ncbi:kinase-like domain-containing protein [Emericellopsis atlantica]|uniref:Kinase-like domain-containing protein n=1 Tax=Emericellopsis atlantica TaxID=2614577 RepID=A0A9P7ZQ35_9HYPO|nr:kinase-like domain-containing protein [Emericellopsis atlantica]KAG9255772.1 kinase-like domain-containing protein [Emericellopsis atlantica]